MPRSSPSTPRAWRARPRSSATPLGLFALLAALGVSALGTWKPHLLVAGVLGAASLAWLSFLRAWTFDFQDGRFTGAIWFVVPVWRVSGSLREVDLVELRQRWRTTRDDRLAYWTLSIRSKGHFLRVAPDTSDCPGAVDAASIGGDLRGVRGDAPAFHSSRGQRGADLGGGAEGAQHRARSRTQNGANPPSPPRTIVELFRVSPQTP